LWRQRTSPNRIKDNVTSSYRFAQRLSEDTPKTILKSAWAIANHANDASHLGIRKLYLQRVCVQFGLQASKEALKPALPVYVTLKYGGLVGRQFEQDRQN